MTLNWSTFIGTDDPDTRRRMRYFNQFLWTIPLTDNFQFIAGFDLGTQQIARGSSAYNFWLGPVIIGQYTINDKWKTAIRVEYYHDKTGIIIRTATPNGFQTTGFSVNLDYLPTQHISCRVEGRWLNSKDSIFETQTNPTNNNYVFASSVAITFGERLGK